MNIKENSELEPCFRALNLPRTCFGWDLAALLCLAVLNNPTGSHIQGFGLPPSFMHMHVPPSQRALCLGGTLGTCVPGWTPSPAADSLCASEGISGG